MDRKKFIGKKCCTKDEDYYIKLGFNIGRSGYPAYYGIDGKYIPKSKFNKKNLIVKNIQPDDWTFLETEDGEGFQTWFEFLVFEQQKKVNMNIE